MMTSARYRERETLCFGVETRAVLAVRRGCGESEEVGTGQSRSQSLAVDVLRRETSYRRWQEEIAKCRQLILWWLKSEGSRGTVALGQDVVGVGGGE